MAQTFLKVTHKIIDKNTGATAINDVNGMEDNNRFRKSVLLVVVVV